MRPMRAVALGALTLAALLLVVFALLPEAVERSLNRVATLEARAPSEAARALHDELFVLDLHDDALLWSRDLLARSDVGHTDLPRWREGNVGLQVLAAVTKTPLGQNFERNRADAPDMITLLAVVQRWPLATWSSLRARALHVARRFDRLVETSAGVLRAVRSRADLDALVAARRAGEPVMGVLLAAEGLHPLEADAANLERLYRAGYRMLAPAHFFDNAIGGSAHGVEKGGLSSLGERVFDRMHELGIVADLAHASPRAVSDILDRARGPVVVSHTGVQATCPGPRNLSDAQLRRIAQGGGVVAIAFFAGAVCDASPAGIARAMRHAADVAGVQHVALGSDWNGGTTVQVDAPRLVWLTDALLREGFTPDEVRAVMGGNALRVLRERLPDGLPDRAR